MFHCISNNLTLVYLFYHWKKLRQKHIKILPEQNVGRSATNVLTLLSRHRKNTAEMIHCYFPEHLGIYHRKVIIINMTNIYHKTEG